MVQELSQDNLSELVAENKTVIVQYSATWCGNCRIMKPKFKKLASENENVVFIIVNGTIITHFHFNFVEQNFLGFNFLFIGLPVVFHHSKIVVYKKQRAHLC